MLRMLLAASLLAVPSAVNTAAAPLSYAPSAPETPAIIEEFIQYPLISQVLCPRSRGTAFRTGPTEFFTADHVARNEGCTIDGAPMRPTYRHMYLDFAKLYVPITSERAVKISCEGFKPGQWYWAAGYALGRPFQHAVPIYATIYQDPYGKRIFNGGQTVIPGDSGGPVMNAAGEVVGIVNAYSPALGLSFSQPLSNTPVCKGAA